MRGPEETGPRPPRRGGPTSATGTGLCATCAWDCLQPVGITVTCPHWRRRGPGEVRQIRSGQLSFEFAPDAGARGVRPTRTVAPRTTTPPDQAKPKVPRRPAPAEPAGEGLFVKRRRRRRPK